jgi:hypothetical protein
MDLQLKGKRAWVTGARIVKAIAKHLASAGKYQQREYDSCGPYCPSDRVNGSSGALPVTPPM